MPNLNVNFAGQTLIRPGSYYADNVSLAYQAAPPTTPPLIFIGYGYGQKPQTAITYANGATLVAAMRGGPCATFVPFMMTPSPELFGAQLVTWINVGENTQSSLTLNNAAGSGVAVLTSANYGLPSNLLQAQVVAGALAGKRVTPAGLGTMRTDNPTFVVLLIGVIVLVGALTFFPALLLGPIVQGLTGHLY